MFFNLNFKIFDVIYTWIHKSKIKLDNATLVDEGIILPDHNTVG